MKITTATFLLLISLLVQGQSIEQITFTGEPEILLELGHRFDINYLTISHHEYRMAFTELHHYQGEVVSKGDMEKFHGFNWALEILPDYPDDGDLITPIGYDREGGFYFSRVESFEDGSHKSTINYLSTRLRVYDDIVPDFKNHSGLQSGTIANNERFMIISTHGDFTHGKDDLYVIEYINGEWGHLTSLGSQVNSKDQEITPFLGDDNKTLFFASDRAGGKGSFDIYMTKRLDDTWRNWSKPVNVYEINSWASETSFCFYDTDPYAYFVMSDEIGAYGDIMEVPIQLNIEEDSTFVEIEERSEVAFFKVVNSTTEESIPAELVVVEDGRDMKNASGIFEVKSMNGKTLVFKSEGYFSHKYKLGDEVLIGETVIYLEPLTIGSSITLEDVLFERASPRILPSSYDELDLLIEVMNENPELKIVLKGHTDGLGNPESNLALSQGRVDQVTEYLRDHGINRRRISGVGYGDKYPIASNETEETRRLNRRVEFEIIE